MQQEQLSVEALLFQAAFLTSLQQHQAGIQELWGLQGQRRQLSVTGALPAVGPLVQAGFRAVRQVQDWLAAWPP